jgi:V/A-type H+-transporting ATPase subunit A
MKSGVDVTLKIGRITRINGPVVHLSGLGDAARFEFVEIGERRLPGEVLSIDHDDTVAQIYEDTSGLTVGQPATALGHPFTAQLSPGLLGGIYDGLLRPLDTGQQFLRPTDLARPRPGPLDFTPHAIEGVSLEAGESFGIVTRPNGTEMPVVVPPHVSGRLEQIVSAGTYESSDTIATVGGIDVTFLSEWPVRTPRPYRQRLRDRVPFATGQRVLDILEPIAKGSSATVIGGFGEGKTMLLEQIAKWSDADIIIYVGCGERGNEMADLIDELSNLDDPNTGRRLLERTIVLANTSNMPVMAREASIYTGAAVAEYFRDMGLDVVIIADSTSRWAEAQRELASRTGAIPAEQGYPADLPTSLAAFYQRAGRVTTSGGLTGSVTIVTSVSPPGGDTTEPVSAHTQRFVQAVWALDRDLAYARHYPAVSWDGSFSRDSAAVGRWHAANGDADWSNRRSRLLSILAEAGRLQGIADLVGRTSLPADERLTLLTARLVREAILQQSALSTNDASCAQVKQAALTGAVLDIYDTGRDLIRGGLPASVIESVDFGPIIRAKDDTVSDDADGVNRIVADTLRAMRELSA